MMSNWNAYPHPLPPRISMLSLMECSGTRLKKNHSRQRAQKNKWRANIEIGGKGGDVNNERLGRMVLF